MFIVKNISGLGRKSRRARSARVSSDQAPVGSVEKADSSRPAALGRVLTLK